MLAAGLVAGFPLSGFGQQTGGLDAPQPVGAFYNGIFPQSAPGAFTGWTTDNAFPNLTFVDPLWLAEIPGANQFLLVGKNGTLWRFANDPAVTQGQVVQVLDWAAKTQTSEDQGFYSLAFHPQFGQAGSPNANFVYVCYNHKPALAGADPNHSYWRVSRFNWNAAAGIMDPNSEFVLINQYDRGRWHNGGAMFFDAAGYLYITDGDGGDSSQGGGLTGPDGALSRTQRLDFGLFSGVFKIDVDYAPGSSRSHAIRRQPQSPANKPAAWPASATQGYGIPNDNPWLDAGGSIMEEYFSHGYRSPHTMHYDAVLNEIWLGDVGQGAREEISRVAKGGNAQWGYREGSIAGPGNPASPPIGTEMPPAYDYGRSVGSCIIGGMRYRGAKWAAELGGKLLFGDHAKGRIWTGTFDGGGGPPAIAEIVSGFSTGDKVGLANFCTDAAGEVYLMDLNGTNKAGGTIRKLATAGVSAEPPQLLSQTGVFTNLTTLATAAGVIPYDVADPLWSDGADKRRWIVLPNDGTHDTAAEKIVFSEKDPWKFPAGTVFVKHFEIHPDERNPAIVRRLETRFLVCTADGGKYGVTYKWNADNTDAVLLETGAREDFQYTYQNGTTETRQWDYPARADCLLCHTPAAGQALGVKTFSLNRTFHYEATGRDANEIATFNALGMFDRTLTAAEIGDFIEGRAIDDQTAPLEHRVRSYLDSNCSHCHRPGGTVDFFDARLGTPLDLQGIVNGAILGHFNLPGGRYLKPADADLSAIQVRMAHVGDGVAMPPLAKNEIDEKAVDRLREYIGTLTDTEFQTTPSPVARYIKLTASSEVNGNKWTSVAEFSVLDGNGVPIPTSQLAISAVDSQELTAENTPATNAIDGNPATFWHTQYGNPEPPPPHYITIDLGSARAVGGFVYTPRQDGPNGRIAGYKVEYGTDGTSWTLMKSGTWPNSTATQTYTGAIGRRKARCQIAGPAGTVAGPFEVTVAFDMDVTDFAASDLQVAGGTVSKLRGKGYYYVATISPNAAQVSVSIPADAANSAGLGSRASAALAVDFLDTRPPAPVFTAVPATVSGPFQIGLTFGEAVTGLTTGDFSATNATLDSITASGNDYVLNLTPLTEGSVSVEIYGGAVMDLAGNQMGAGASVALNYSSQVLARNAAEASYVGGGMRVVTDAAAPGGAYLWLPDGAYAGNYNLPVKTQHRAEYQFVVPRAGLWMLRGSVLASDNSSDSFWVEIDGSQALGTIRLWDTAPVGNNYVWDYVNDRNIADPVVLNLTAGAHTVTIYGRDDGTRLARLELESVRPLVALAGPAGVAHGDFTIAVNFSKSVTGLTTGDFTISGGTAIALAGTGGSYSLTVRPASPLVTVSLPQDAATDVAGGGNFASDPAYISYRSPYQQWAFDWGIDGSDLAQTADGDGDGISNLLEFAFNLNPAKVDAATYDPAVVPGAGLPQMVVADGPVLSLQYLRRNDTPGLVYQAQFGNSVASFATSAAAPLVEDLGGGWERVTVADTGGPGAPRRFGRVRVSLLSQ